MNQEKQQDPESAHTIDYAAALCKLGPGRILHVPHPRKRFGTVVHFHREEQGRFRKVAQTIIGLKNGKPSETEKNRIADICRQINANATYYQFGKQMRLNKNS